MINLNEYTSNLGLFLQSFTKTSYENSKWYSISNTIDYILLILILYLCILLWVLFL